MTYLPGGSFMDDAVLGLIDCWMRLGDLVEGARINRNDGALVGVTGLPVPTLNGVWAPDPPPAARLAVLLDGVAAADVPYCLEVPSTAPAEIAAMAEQRGMARDDDIPLMLLSDVAAVAHTPVPTGLTFRQLGADDLELHAKVAAAGFGAPPEVFEQLVGPRWLTTEGAAVLVAELEGEPVCTGVSLTVNARVGVFNIATPPQHQRHGYGAALTARLVADAALRGARSAWLQSSPAGYAVYERLGFQTVDRWQCWVV
jgi:ribosomal protein S18 acetylase RimI-like enzyme